jgi:hypothetical protein
MITNSTDTERKSVSPSASGLVSVSALPTDELAARMTRTGLCSGANDDRAFPAVETEAAALRLCGGCPARPECLEFALRTEETETGRYGSFGIWGGTTALQRREIKRARPRALAVAS